MSNKTQNEKAEALLALHADKKLLLLPNIWNPIGARILAEKGYPAIATASAAISASFGYADGEKIKLATLLDLLTRIARAVDLPVTADIESGYADTTPELKRSIEQVLDTGVVGINLEDSHEYEGALRACDEQCERIAIVREVASARGVHLVINARTDSFLSSSLKAHEEKLADALARANAYVQAGADCVYPIGPGDLATIQTLRREIAAPINILATPAAASLQEIEDAGINRVSFGPFIFRSLLKKFSDITDNLLEYGDYSCFGDSMFSREQASAFVEQGYEP
jgi:2-methylisocitrate lyase-like PEP mutase family enzyme